MDNPTGLDLKVERTRLRVTGRQLALTMGVSAQRVSHIEAAQFPSAETVRRYRDALATSATSPTNATDAEAVA